MNKDDFYFNMLFIVTPIVAITIGLVLMYQFVYIPAKAESEAFDKKYPPQCMIERNQTVILLNANDKETLYHPIKICQVWLSHYPDDKGMIQYFADYQYESQAKYNKPFHETILSCKPKTFDEVTGNFICMDGSIAKEKDIFA